MTHSGSPGEVEPRKVIGRDGKTYDAKDANRPTPEVSNLDTLDGTLTATEGRRLTGEIRAHLHAMFAVVGGEIARARSNRISAAEIAGSLTIAMRETEGAQPEYLASFVRRVIYDPIINGVMADISDDPYRQYWDRETFRPLTDEDRQSQLDRITAAVTV